MRCDTYNFLCPVFVVCRRQKTMQVDATVFTCISMLSRAMGPSIQPDIKELLEPMLAVGLRCTTSIQSCRNFLLRLFYLLSFRSDLISPPHPVLH